MTGIPMQMKLEAEAKTGKSYDNVRVTYGSDEPGRYGAVGMTRLGPGGPEIHLARGAEGELRHELVHVNQQLSGVVRATGRVGGAAVNDDRSLERDADMGRFVAYRTEIPAPNGLLQRKLDVGVSLRHREDGGKQPGANYVVDTIKLSGRSSTGLEKGSQGDHTIADALVKKYQKIMVRGLPLPNAKVFYRNLFAEIILQNSRMPDNADDVSKSRVQTSNAQANEGQSLIEAALKEDVPKTVTEHRKDLVQIIRLYNDAYAHSYTATQGRGTGGHGEKEGMGAVRTALKEGEVTASLFKLLDYGSVRTYQQDETAMSIVQKFLFMLQHMRGYGNREDFELIQRNNPMVQDYQDPSIISELFNKDFAQTCMKLLNEQERGLILSTSLLQQTDELLEQMAQFMPVRAEIKEFLQLDEGAHRTALDTALDGILENLIVLDWRLTYMEDLGDLQADESAEKMRGAMVEVMKMGQELNECRKDTSPESEERMIVFRSNMVQSLGALKSALEQFHRFCLSIPEQKRLNAKRQARRQGNPAS